MPGFDATGPLGQGAMTGWKNGRCRDTPPESRSAGRGRGGGQGRGGRRCRRGQDAAGRGSGRAAQRGGLRQNRVTTPETAATNDLEALKREAETTAQSLERIKARIAAWEAESTVDPLSASGRA